MKPFKTCLRPDGEHHGKKRDKQPSLRHIHCSDSHAEAATEVPHFAGRTRVAVLAGIAVRRVENLLLGWHSSFGAVLREDKSGFTFMWGPSGGMVRLWSEAFQGSGWDSGLALGLRTQCRKRVEWTRPQAHICHYIGGITCSIQKDTGRTQRQGPNK